MTMPHAQFRIPTHCTQRGAVLIVSLLLLLVMTILALGASQATRMDERMARSVRDKDLSFQSAEAGLRAGERYLDTLVVKPSPCASAPCTTIYELNVLTTATTTYDAHAYQTDTWWDTNGRTYSASAVISGSSDGTASAEPDFYIEQLEEVPDALSLPPTGPPPSRTFYRVSARALGGTGNGVSMLQSTYSRRF